MSAWDSRRLLAAGAGALSCVALLAFAACSDAGAEGSPRTITEAPADSELVLGQVDDFVLLDTDAEPFGSAELAGRTWVLSNIFTTCSTVCPGVTSSMAELAGRLADTEVVLVSISVDPKLDTPERMKAYAAEYGADTERWKFLTGTENEIRDLMESVGLAAKRNDEAPFGEQVSHGTRLVVIDAAGAIRGYYGSKEVGLDRCEERLRYLDASGATHAGR